MKMAPMTQTLKKPVIYKSFCEVFIGSKYLKAFLYLLKQLAQSAQSCVEASLSKLSQKYPQMLKRELKYFASDFQFFYRLLNILP